MSRKPLPEMSSSDERPQGTPLSVQVPRPAVIKRSIYWVGMLPAEGTVELMVPSSEYNDEYDGWVKRVKTTAAKLWDRKDMRIWLGKCRTYQSLDAGTTFPAYTEQVQLDRESGARAAIPHPGGIVTLSDSEVELVLRRVTRNVLRNGKLVNLDQGNHSRIDPNDPKTVPYTDPMVQQPGDHPVAEYVYMVKVGDDATNYKPDEFYRHIPMDMKTFFASPPPMLASYVEAEVA